MQVNTKVNRNWRKANKKKNPESKHKHFLEVQKMKSTFSHFHVLYPQMSDFLHVCCNSIKFKLECHTSGEEIQKEKIL